MQFFENVVVVGASDALRETDGHFDVGFQRPFQHLIDFAVIVVVVTDAEHALDVIPDGRAEARRVHVPFRAHEVVGQLVHQPEFVVQQVADVVVQPVDEREGVIVPRIILNPKRRDQTDRSATCKVLVEQPKIVQSLKQIDK